MLEFLSGITLKEVEVPTFGKARIKIEAPTQGDLRVFKNGTVIPSESAIKKFKLEYTKKGSKKVNNGFDVFISSDSPALAHNKVSFLVVGVVPKDAGKVSLFDRTTYNEEGEPKRKVSEQGVSTFGKELVTMLERVGLDFPEGQNYIDFTIVEGSKLESPNGVYFIPKTVSRGAKKGTLTIEVRNDIDMFPLIPSSQVLEDEYTEGKAPVEIESGNTIEDEEDLGEVSEDEDLDGVEDLEEVEEDESEVEEEVEEEDEDLEVLLEDEEDLEDEEEVEEMEIEEIEVDKPKKKTTSTKSKTTKQPSKDKKKVKKEEVKEEEVEEVEEDDDFEDFDFDDI